MNDILKKYYNINVDYISDGYFYYKKQYYYFTKIKISFFEIYSYYEYMIYALNIYGYRVVRNCNNELCTKNYVLLLYQESTVDLRKYYYISLKPILKYNLEIYEIKNRWIEKIDNVRKEISKYSFSFQYNRDLNALIHYYSGMAENGINILNEIISLYRCPKIYLSLSLKKPITPSIHELLNPDYYTISSKVKHVINLIKSNILSIDELDELINKKYFDDIELMYLYARSFYNAEFFDLVLRESISDDRIKYYIKKRKDEMIFIRKIGKIIRKYISLPEISWIE